MQGPDSHIKYQATFMALSVTSQIIEKIRTSARTACQGSCRLTCIVTCLDAMTRSVILFFYREVPPCRCDFSCHLQMQESLQQATVALLPANTSPPEFLCSYQGPVAHVFPSEVKPCHLLQHLIVTSGPVDTTR